MFFGGWKRLSVFLEVNFPCKSHLSPYFRLARLIHEGAEGSLHREFF
jgi:hypothetical protein